MVGAIPPLADQRVDRPVDHELSGATGDPGGQATATCQVLSGLAGVGKTQAAAALAWRLWDARQVDLLVWVSAASRSAILARFADAFARVTGVDDAEHGAERFLAWLTEPHRHPWLVVLDNLDDPDDLTGLWPPVTVGGKTVVTT
jgi:hypothetical protein